MAPVPASSSGGFASGGYGDFSAGKTVALNAQQSSVLSESGRISSERASIWKSEGNSRLTAGDISGALECYTRGVECAKQAGLTGKLLSQLHSNRAQVHIRLGNHAEALEDCETAIANDMTNGRAYWRGATAAMRLDKAEAAAAICMRGIKAVGDSAGLASLLEEARARQQVQSQAAVEAQHDLAAPVASEEEAQKEQEAQESSVGQELAERAASLLQTFQQTEESLRKEEDIRRSIRLFQASLQEDPTNEVALIGLGEIFDDGLGEAPKDVLAAKHLWLQAAKAGSQRAQMKLCVQALELWAVSTREAAFPGQDNGSLNKAADKPDQAHRAV